MTLRSHGPLTLLTHPDDRPVPVPLHNSPGVYADPAAWAVLEGVRRSWADRPVATTDTGVIVCTETACRDAVEAVRRQSLHGRIRPRHFTAAGPGTLAGLLCTVLGFRGPSLVLTAPAARAHKAAQFIATVWLAQRQCDRVVAVEHREPRPAEHLVRVRVTEAP